MEPNRNDSKNRNNNSGDNKRPKGSIWITLIITVAIVLAISLIYNAISRSQYTQTTYTEFREAMDNGQLAEVELLYDRVIYLTKDEAAKPAGQQKACFTGLPGYADTLALMDELHALGYDVNYHITEDNSGIIMILFS